MVEEKWLDSGKRAQAKFPQTQKNWSDVPDDPNSGYLQDRVINELKNTLGIDEQMLETGGLKITTTFRKDLQDYTNKAVSQIRKQNGLKNDIQFGLAAIDPKTGGVVAAYGGPDYRKQQFDNSFQGKVQPGSSFKPIVLATALDQGISLRTTMDGTYKRTINGASFTNDSRSENGVYNLKQMTAMSINTAYVDLGQKVQLANVVDMAKKMGIPKDTPNLSNTITSLPLGVIDASPVTMASVYSTFAASGKHRDAHVIAKVTDNRGRAIMNNDHKLLEKLPWQKPTTAFDEGVAADATNAMQAVVTSGTGKRASLGALSGRRQDRYHRREQVGLVRRLHAGAGDVGGDVAAGQERQPQVADRRGQLQPGLRWYGPGRPVQDLHAEGTGRQGHHAVPAAGQRRSGRSVGEGQADSHSDLDADADQHADLPAGPGAAGSGAAGAEAAERLQVGDAEADGDADHHAAVGRRAVQPVQHAARLQP
ncbi:transglycosylase domain-containing protein [Actinomadura luteofluorescens]|uniref:transglycosylase domain-containing protein n=1 Tax=Actinomadura luteofluorescens TaxID=46163 RepID=UPI0036429333